MKRRHWARSAAAAVAFASLGTEHVMAQDSAITTYGSPSPAAPEELRAFSFLVGKWEGGGRARLADGPTAEFDGVTWIGRYVLDGMAIADEGHAAAPDGSPAFGISLRYFDPAARSWIVEYINVSSSFIRRQVNGRSGSVEVTDTSVVVTGRDGETVGRERYDIVGDDRFDYALDISRDGGRTWDRGTIEMTMTRVE